MFEELTVSSVEDIVNQIRAIQSDNGNKITPLLRGEGDSVYSPTAGIFRPGFLKIWKKIFFGSFFEIFQVTVM